MRDVRRRERRPQTVARPTLAYRFVLTADACVNDVKKETAIADVRNEVTAPTPTDAPLRLLERLHEQSGGRYS